MSRLHESYKLYTLVFARSVLVKNTSVHWPLITVLLHYSALQCIINTSNSLPLEWPASKQYTTSFNATILLWILKVCV
jgi:hypothetical protein